MLQNWSFYYTVMQSEAFFKEAIGFFYRYVKFEACSLDAKGLLYVIL